MSHIKLSSATKEEVVSNFAKYWDARNDNSYPHVFETKQHREQRLMDELWANRVWQDNYEASFRPRWETTGPRLSVETGEQYRRYIGSYGHTRMD